MPNHKECINIDDLRLHAKRRLPKSVFEFIDGGAHDEITLRNNNYDFRNFKFVPRVLTDISHRNQEVDLFGQRYSTPLVLGPIGLAGLVRREGENHAAMAAANQNVPFCPSSMSTCSIEEIAKKTSARQWFQLYVLRDRGITREFIRRAKETHCSVLVVTVDTKLLGARERDIRNGFVVPPKFTLSTLFDFLIHIRWLFDVGLGRKIKYRNFDNTSVNANSVMSITEFIKEQWDVSINWDDIAWFKEQWGGPVVIKGILSPEDARIAESIGADGVIVSNHGGRQLDGAISSISALAKIKASVSEDYPLILDGGIRRGSDVVKAIALGTKACMLGRPWLYGLASGGQDGVERCIEILKAEIDLTLGLLGVTQLNDLNPSYLSRTSDFDSLV